MVWRAEYEPYGSVYAYRAGDDGDPQALRLPGQEAADPIVGQEYNIFRWYRSEWGRYTQAAPLAVGGLGIFAHGRFERYTIPNIRRSEEHADAVKEWGVGVFSYAAGNPVGVTDSVGLKALKCKVSTIKSSPNRTIRGKCVMLGECHSIFNPWDSGVTFGTIYIPSCFSCPKK